MLRALLERPVIGNRLARLLGKDVLTPQHQERLTALAALHDLGKISQGFQNAPFRVVSGSRGHVKPLVSLIQNERCDPKVDKALAALITSGGLAGLAHLLESPDGLPLARLPMQRFCVVLAHHGSLPGAQPGDAQLWRAARGYDPVGACRDLVDAIQTWLGSAVDPAPLDWTYNFGHAFAGLVTLADWLGSDATIFTWPGGDVPDGPARFAWSLARARDLLATRLLAPQRARAAAGRLDWNITELTTFEAASPAQHAMLSLPPPPDAGRICLIEDETGSGKTEAALIHFLDLFRAGAVDGLYFALPTRAAAAQIHGRIEAALCRLLRADAPPVVLAVPGYLGRGTEATATMPQDGVLWSEEKEKKADALWASERPKRYLAACVAVGTIDQVLMGGLRVRHAQLRSAAMLRLLLVVDEVHSSDVYMTVILRNLLDQHLRAGGHALLMSATLGGAARVKLLRPHGHVPPPNLKDAQAAPYPAVWTDTSALPFSPPEQRHAQGRPQAPVKQVEIVLDPNWADPAAVALRAVAAARRGARVLVIRNTVRDTVATQQALEAVAPEISLTVEGAEEPIASPHHARYAPEDRLALDAALEAVLGGKATRTQGKVVIASQTAEQSLDIDADLLITDLCPADVLLQRIGRLHRHRRARPTGFVQPVAIVLAPPEDALAGSIGVKGEVTNPPLALGLVYPNLLGIVATRRALAPGRLSIPHDNRHLVEAATHPDGLEALAKAMGGRWQERWQVQEGAQGAQAQAARGAYLGWDCPIEPLPGLDERIVTRLGLDDRAVALPEGTIGPFGRVISMLSVPGRWLGGVPADAVVKIAITGAGAFALDLEGRSFIYDRFGLRPQG